MCSKEAIAMEEGKAGLESGGGKLNPVDVLPNLTPTTLSSKLSLDTGNEKHQLRSRAIWKSVAPLIWWKRAQHNDDGIPTHDNRALRVPIVRGLEQCAEGYPRLAALLDSDDNFMIYRRFGFLSTRLLLDQQDRLRLLEEELDERDQDDAENNPNRNLTRDLLEEDSKEGRELLVKIKQEYCEYAKILCAARKLMSFNKPASHEWQSVENYIWNKKQVEEKESRFIYHKEDLVTLRPGREYAWLDTSVEKLLKWFNCGPVEWLFCSRESRQKSRGSEVYYTRTRIERFVAGIITLVILLLLVVPIYLLYQTTSNLVDTGREDAIAVGILLVSTLSFSAIISVFTRARRHEIFAASAAYCAVLVVFIGNIGGRRSTQSPST